MQQLDSKNGISSFPHFIIDKPEGTDLFEGKSQETLADNIVQFVNENELYKRKVIGIEGEWGSGKSNVIEILKKKLNDDYYFYVFDAWGHQEDLTRRSLLEGLLNTLVNKEQLLTGNSKNGKAWTIKLKELLAKKKETSQISIPKISTAILLTSLGLILFTISNAFAAQYLKHLLDKNVSIGLTGFFAYVGITLFAFTPLLLYIFVYKWWWENDRKNLSGLLGSLFYIFKGKEIENTTSETISEDEPSIIEFANFITDIEESSGKKLVIVFDNMDRLPSEKVKAIWSSIHTFFASDENDIKSWAIVPFDNDHISNIFTEVDKSGNTQKNTQLHAESYIHKTFTIVYHVAPPILSDWQKFLKEKYREAFGVEPKPEENVETIFDYYHLIDPKIKPRDIICYINDLVALKKLWKNEIDTKYLCLFALKRMEIMKNPFQQILSQSYLGSLGPIFTLDEKLDKSIAALAFNVALNKAEEILLSRPIQKALNGEGTLSDLLKQKAFLPAFDSAYYKNAMVNIRAVANCLEILGSAFQEDILRKYWDRIAAKILEERFDAKNVSVIKAVVKALKNHVLSERLLKFLFLQAITQDGNDQKFYGSKYYDLISEIKILLHEVWKEKAIETLLPDNHMEADEYYDFISRCPIEYEKYKVICDAKKINDYLIGRFITNGIAEHELNYIIIIKPKVNLEDFRTHIAEVIPTLSLTLQNYQDTLTNIIDIGKALSTDGKFTFIIPESIFTPLLTANPTHPRIIDLLQLIISSNVTTPNLEHTKNAVITKLLTDTNLIESFIESYSYYFNYSDLVKYYLQFPSTLIKEVIIKLTNSSDKLQGSDVLSLISKYSDIKSKIFNDDIALCNSFVSKIDSFYQKNEGAFINSDNLPNAIQFLSDNLSNDCELVNDFVKESIQFINSIDKNIWVEALKDTPNSNHIKIFNKLIETNKYQIAKLPHYLDEAYKETIIAISKKESPVPEVDCDLWDKLYEMHTAPFNQTFKTVRDNLINPSNGDVQFDQLLFFEKGLFNHGGLYDSTYYADESLRRIFTPLVLESEDYKNILKRNIDSLKRIVENAYNSIMEFNAALSEKCPQIFDDEFRPVSDVLLSKINSINEAQNFKNVL